VAAKILEHHFIGINISPDYVAFARKRLENYRKEIPAAEEEMAKHVVRKTFKERKERGEWVGRFRKGCPQNTEVEKRLFE